MLVDIHAHLDYEPLFSKVAEIVERAKKAGVVAIVSNGTRPESNRRVLDLAKKFDIIKPSLGYFPDHVVEDGLEAVEKELEFISKKKPIALGEVGLDFATHKDKPKEMVLAFEKIIALSEKLKIPLIVHSRKAEQEVIEMLESSKNKKIIMHFFCGRKALVKRVQDNGWTFSIPTNIVRLQQLQQIVEEVPLNQILTETDCPWLSPFPAQENEPAFVKETIKKIVQIKKMEETEVIKNIYMNYQQLFL